jgi:hypothetical protein
VHSDDALADVGAWSRRLHDATESFVPPGDRVALGAAVADRAGLNAAAIRRLAATGDPTYTVLLAAADDLEQAAREVAALPRSFWT